MKKVLITIIIILAVGKLSAQNVTFGVRGGMNFSNMMPVGETTPLNDGFSMRTAPNFGIFTELQVNPTLSFRLGVEYSALGGKKDGIQAFPTSRILNDIGMGMAFGMTDEQMVGFMLLAAALSQMPHYYANVNTTVKIDYVKIPLLAQLGTDIGTSPWRVYANAGPFVSFILSANQVSSGVSRLFTNMVEEHTLWHDIEAVDQTIPGFSSTILAGFPDIKTILNDPVTFGTTDITGEMRSANFGISGNLGIRYQHNRHNFFLEVGGSYGFFRVQQNDNGGNRLGALSVVLGYSFSLW
ncbi:MAG: PorT family protein [Bacteroidales bacterium]|nr:PorT family protein [Bacteroidales bacterium]